MMAAGTHDRVRVPEGGRWSCHNCGLCCRYHELGPVEPEIIAGLEARDIGSHWPAAADGSWYQTRTASDGSTTHWLTKRDAACVFLREDNLCAVHALFGAEAKPGFCRAFPFTAVSDPTGTVVVARPDCGGFFASTQDGQLIADQAAEALAIPHSQIHKQFSPAQVHILAGDGIPLQDWLILESELCTTLYDLDLEPHALVALIRDRLLAAIGRPPVEPDPRKAAMAAGAVLQALKMVMDHILSTETAPSPAEAAFAAEMRENIGTAQAHIHDSPPPLDPETRSTLNLHVRSHLLGKRFAGQGGVGAGLGMFLLNVRVARWAAHAAPDTTVGYHHPRWVRFALNRSLQPILARTRPALEDLFLGVGKQGVE